MIRVNIIVEGQTEETFVNKLLIPCFSEKEIWLYPRCIITSRKRGRAFKGGMTNYVKAKNDLTRWLKQETKPGTFFTCMFDLYALPNDFPGVDESKEIANPYEKVKFIEKKISQDINDIRFFPYIQLFEFEALLLSNPEEFVTYYPDGEYGIQKLIDLVQTFESPEFINDGVKTAPSKRIREFFPTYCNEKTSAAPIIAENIGLSTIRSKCKHFDEWLTIIENLRGEDEIP